MPFYEKGDVRIRYEEVGSGRVDDDVLGDVGVEALFAEQCCGHVAEGALVFVADSDLYFSCTEVFEGLDIEWVAFLNGDYDIGFGNF